MTEREFRDYLGDILDHARKLKAFVAEMTFEEFQTDEKTQFAVMRAVEVIGEATKRIKLSMGTFTARETGTLAMTRLFRYLPASLAYDRLRCQCHEGGAWVRI